MSLIPSNLSLPEGAENIAPYIVSNNLYNAVKYAHYLKRPLLLRGEPGCGKTQFAKVLAHQIYAGSGIDYRTKYFEWHVKSTSKASEGIYTFDYLARLHDSQISGATLKPDKDYVKFGELGKAFRESQPTAPSILLIDEIDKADIDFPNDLLLELDQKRFFISELNEFIEAKESPVVIITSNDEKELPSAFLRRCVFYYIAFPGKDQLQEIVEAHMKSIYSKNDTPLSKEAIENIVKEFEGLHTRMKSNPNASKIISTSELLDWAKIIYGQQKDTSQIELVRKENRQINYPEVLFKTLNDFNLFSKKA